MNMKSADSGGGVGRLSAVRILSYGTPYSIFAYINYT